MIHLHQDCTIYDSLREKQLHLKKCKKESNLFFSYGARQISFQQMLVQILNQMSGHEFDGLFRKNKGF